ncbi:MAG TPA: GNAT family N-acetyltransferase [Proteobacteria bacterium]|nr:GNAT family N-acetyltransferase [Pseudomonadota bacterium]
MFDKITLEQGYRTGAIGQIAALHAEYYHAPWQFGLYFEAQVATGLGRFLRRYQEDRDGLWLVRENHRIKGSLAIDALGADTRDGAHLRWFIVEASLRGRGLGQKLLNQAIGFCRERNYRKIYLWTFAGLDPARHLYEKAGFVLSRQQSGDRSGPEIP